MAIFQLNMLACIITEARSTRGDDIKNEKVTPIGKPALVNPMNSGMDEHEQKGVTVPSNAPSIFAEIPRVSAQYLSLFFPAGRSSGYMKS
jgi:hypothetical protein